MKLNIWPGYINGIELQYMLKYMLNYIVRADDCDMICWIVGFNLTFDVHKKPDTFTLLNHYTVIMAFEGQITRKKVYEIKKSRDFFMIFFIFWGFL